LIQRFPALMNSFDLAGENRAGRAVAAD